MDQLLDIVISPDQSAWRWKDEDEFEQAAAWYDERNPGLGAEFVACVRAKVEQLVELPQLWPAHRGTRRALLSRFPYAIVYRDMAEDGIEIIAIAHHKRRPKYWSGR